MSVANLDATGFVASSGKARPVPILVSRHIDGLLVGWLAVALWFVAAIAKSSGRQLDLTGPAFVWPATLISATHFVISYRLAFTGRRSLVRARPVALVVVPLIIVFLATAVAVLAASGAVRVAGSLESFLVSLVFATSGFHYIKQAYGVVRLGASFGGIRLLRKEIAVLRYGIYPAWIFGLRMSPWLRHVPIPVSTVLVEVARVAALIGVVLIVGVLIKVWRRTETVPSSTMVAPYAAAALWMVFPVTLMGATLVTAVLHALQYLACCHRAELARPERAGAGTAPKSVLVTEEVRNWLVVFGTAGAIGILLVNSIPHVLERWVSIKGASGTFATLFFVTLNLTHYVIDGVIWRSDGPVVGSIAKGSRQAS